MPNRISLLRNSSVSMVIVGWSTLLLCFGCGQKLDEEPRPQPVSSQSPQPSRAGTSAVQFRDITEESGVSFVQTNGAEAGHFAILESLGSGVGISDFDCDGRMDCLLAGGGTFSPKPVPISQKMGLYRNLGAWSFSRVDQSCALQHPEFYNHGVSTADFNNDGFEDFLVTGFGAIALYANNGDGTFENVTAEAMPFPVKWTTGAAWGDINSDGCLDVYVANYVNWSFAHNPRCIRNGRQDVCAPAEFAALDDQLFVSNQDGTFIEGTQSAKLVEGGKGLGVLAADFNVDGHIDFYVANDTTSNFLYLGDGTGRLEERGFACGVAVDDKATPNGSMGLDTADTNNDGRPDIWVANFEDENFALYENLGDGLFQHRSRRRGVSATRNTYVGFGTSFLDFELDGDQDIVVTNGHVMVHRVNSPIRQRPILFENQNGRFENVAASIGGYFAQDHLGRGLAVGDLDNDGAPDLTITHINEPVALLKNDSSTHNWLAVTLVGVKSNRSAIGTRITVDTSSSERHLQVTSGASYLSSNSRRQHIGLGNVSVVTRLEIRWPDGQQSILKSIPSKQHIMVLQSQEGYRRIPEKSER